MEPGFQIPDKSTGTGPNLWVTYPFSTQYQVAYIAQERTRLLFHVLLKPILISTNSEIVRVRIC